MSKPPVDIPGSEVGEIRVAAEQVHEDPPLDIGGTNLGEINEAAVRWRWGATGTYVLLALGTSLFVWGTGWNHDSAAELGKFLVVGVAGVMLNLLKS